MKILTVILLLLAAAAAPAATLWGTGEITCSYAQYPFGPFAGAFHSSGTMVPEGGEPVPGGSAAATGMLETGWALGVLGIQPGAEAGSYDILAILVQGDGAEPGPGSWSGSVSDDTVIAVLMLGVRDLEMPTDFDPADLADLLAVIEADEKLFAVSSSVTVEALGEELLSGTFSGIFAGGSLLVVSIDDGSFALSDGVTPNTPATWSSLKAAWR